MSNYMYNTPSALSATIASGAALTSSISIHESKDTSGAKIPTTSYIFGIDTPADEWTTANLTFQVSRDGGTTFKDFYDATGTEVTVLCGVNRAIQIDPATFAAVTHIKIRSGTTAAPVNQAAARTLVLTLRSV